MINAFKTYILPATTQSRTLQSQQTKLMQQMKSQPSLPGTNNGQATGNQIQNSILTPDNTKPQGLYQFKPESGKKNRASFLLNAQTGPN